MIVFVTTREYNQIFNYPKLCDVVVILMLANGEHILGKSPGKSCISPANILPPLMQRDNWMMINIALLVQLLCGP